MKRMSPRWPWSARCTAFGATSIGVHVFSLASRTTCPIRGCAMRCGGWRSCPAPRRWRRPKSTGTSGHAAESVPLAIYLAARYVTSCEEAILAAVRCGGDTDTTASIAGQICGAAGGTIPEPWIARLPVRDEIEELSEQLAAVSRGEALHR